MKCSEAIKKLEEELSFYLHSHSPDLHDAISLAIGCLRYRMAHTDRWALSYYTLLPGEDREEPLAHEK